MLTKSTARSLAESSWLYWLVVVSICSGAVFVILNTVGVDTYWLDKLVLIIFTVEFYILTKAYGFWAHLRTGWGRFDVAIITVGWLVVFADYFEVPVPEWAAALARVLRLVRLGEKHPAINNVLQTLGASFSGLFGALLLAGLAMGIFILAGTLMFQPAEPFAHIIRTAEHLTLLYEDAIDYYRQQRDPVLGIFLISYQVIMSLTIVNLVITVLIEGMQAGKAILDRFATRADIEELKKENVALLQELSRIKELLEPGDHTR